MKTQRFLITLISLFALMACSPNVSAIDSKTNRDVTVLNFPTASLTVSQEISTPLSTSISGVSALAIQKYTQGKVLTQKKFGFDISVTNFRYESEEIKVDLCFQVPNNADWRVWDATLQTENTNLLLSTIAPREMTQTLPDRKRLITTYLSDIIWQEIPHDGQPDYLCETLGFITFEHGVNLAQVDLTQVKLIIHSLGALPREGEECSVYLDRVQSQLDARGAGIKVDCVTQDAGSQVVITQKPAEMSQSDAEEMVARMNIDSSLVKGPWIFDPASQ